MCWNNSLGLQWGEESGLKRLKEKLVETKTNELLNFLGTINFSSRNRIPLSLGGANKHWCGPQSLLFKIYTGECFSGLNQPKLYSPAPSFEQLNNAL